MVEAVNYTIIIFILCMYIYSYALSMLEFELTFNVHRMIQASWLTVHLHCNYCLVDSFMAQLAKDEQEIQATQLVSPPISLLPRNFPPILWIYMYTCIYIVVMNVNSHSPLPRTFTDAKHSADAVFHISSQHHPFLKLSWR